MTDSTTGRELVVSHDDIGEAHVREQEWSLHDGAVLVAVDRIALTANNVTYAVFGDELHYWDAYPTGDQGLGIVPTWGFGEVVGSRTEDVQVGERLYGFWPTATHALLTPSRVGGRGFVDASEHRAELAGTYQRYERSAADPLHAEETAHLEPLYRPLFTTSFLLDDLIGDRATVGSDVTTVVVTSASSKTSTALAHLLAQRDGAEAVGITSASSVEHVTGTGLWDRVLTYDDVADLGADGPSALVDVAGRTETRVAVHEVLADQLVVSLAVGVTHHDAEQMPQPTTGPRPTFFFAPQRAAQRLEEWGPAEFGQRLAEAWQPFVSWVDESIEVRVVDGLDRAVGEWASLVAGDVDPGEGLLVSPSS